MIHRFKRTPLVAAFVSLVVLAAAAPAGAAQWFYSGTPKQGHADEFAAELPDGTVLVAGDGATPERYNPVDGRWTATAPMAGRHAHAAGAALLDGRVLVAGG